MQYCSSSAFTLEFEIKNSMIWNWCVHTQKYKVTNEMSLWYAEKDASAYCGKQYCKEETNEQNTTINRWFQNKIKNLNHTSSNLKCNRTNTCSILRFISRMLRGKSLSSSLRVIATEDVNMHSIIVRSEMCVTYTSSK